MLNTTDKIIKHKTGLLNLAEELGNVSKACQVMGMSRDTFYRYKSAVEEGGVEALFERTRRKPNLANRVDEATEKAVVKSATDFPAYGQARTSNELRKLGVFVSPSGVRSIWLRHRSRTSSVTPNSRSPKRFSRSARFATHEPREGPWPSANTARKPARLTCVRIASTSCRNSPWDTQ